MEVEMDEKLGWGRCQRAEASSTPNYRNGYMKKTVKTQLGEVDIRVPRDRIFGCNGSLPLSGAGAAGVGVLRGERAPLSPLDNPPLSSAVPERAFFFFGRFCNNTHYKPATPLQSGVFP